MARYRPPFQGNGDNKPVFQGKLEDSRRISVTRVSSDGRLLVTASHDWLMLYRNPNPG